MRSGFGSAAMAGGHPALLRIVGRLQRRRAVLYAFFGSRLMLLAIGLLTQIFLEPVSTQVSPLQLTDSPLLRMWGQWDTGWYVTLATEGYARSPGPTGEVNWAFFPAFPMLSAGIAAATGLPVFTAMLLLSNVSFLAALFLAHRFATEAFDDRTADLTVALICAAPGSYIFSSAYTESLFLLALCACLVLLRSRRWIAAGAAAAVAVLTRNLGVALVLAMMMEAGPGLLRLRQAAAAKVEGVRLRLSGEALRLGVGLALPVLAFAAFCAFLYQISGDPLAFATAQQAWGRRLLNPAARAIAPLARGDLQAADVVNFAACWLSLAMLASLALMRRWSLFILACVLTMIPLASGMTSYARYCLVVLPLFLAGAKLLSTRPAAAMTVLTVFGMLNGFMVVAWTLGMWVTV